MANGCGSLRVIDDEVLAECVSSAIHKDNTEEIGTLLRREQETNRSAKEKNSSAIENSQKAEKKDTEPLDIEAFFPKSPANTDARVGSNLLGDQDTSGSSKSHFSRYSKHRSELSVYEPSLDQTGKCTRMMPYLIPQRRNSTSNDISSGKRKSFKDGKNIKSLFSVSDHHWSDATSKYGFNKKSTNNSDIDMHGRSHKDHIQHLIFKIYSEQQTLEELLRCRTQGCFKPCNPPCQPEDVLDQPLSAGLSPPKFIQKYVFNAVAEPNVCLKNPEFFKVPEGGDYKEELFDSIHVPYFKEKQGLAKLLDELFSMKRSSRINFI